MKLLIVNDEQLTAENMKEKVSWEQYGVEHVYVAYDAKSGRKCIEENNIDILLCDIEMPGENGIALLRWIREQKKDVECIFVSCHAEFEYAKAAVSLGCQDYILIPVAYEEIGKAVEKVVDRKRSREKERYYAEYGITMMRERTRIEKGSSVEKNSKISKEETIDRAIALIRENLSDSQMNVEWIGEKFHFHPVYINRIFKEKMGITMSKFITTERMKMAVALLEQGESNAIEIAARVGYQQYTNFFVAFKKYYGCSPAQYRELYIKGGNSQQNE